MDPRQPSGIVSLVGAGPGDVGLLTLRGRALLEQADAIVYDYLANPRLLRFARPQARLIYAGKKAAAHAMTQAQINQLLVELGAAGQRVVRLKGGDPFVFGRGGEECEALAAAGVAFEVVPGITAALAAPAYAGIPVTHRDLNSSFTFITGHEKEEAYKDPQAAARPAAAGSSDIDWAAVARLPCIAFYMGVKSLPRIAQRLIQHGMDPTTPAAAIQWGTRPQQRTVTATLATLAGEVERQGLGAPAITIIGRVVELRQSLNWFETRPLFGRQIAVLRTRQQASALSQRLEELGADVIEAPTIELHGPADAATVQSALEALTGGAYDWVVFTSANGVTHTRAALLERQLDARALAGCRIAAIGQATAEALQRELCVCADFIPQRAVAEALAEELAAAGQVAGGRFLLLRADIGRPVLVDHLRASGAAQVDDVAIYQTRPAAALPPEFTAALAQGSIDWITFASSSSAHNLAHLLGEGYRDRLRGIRLASIGPITSAALRSLGFEPAVEADTADLDALVDAIRARVSADAGDREGTAC